MNQRKLIEPAIIKYMIHEYRQTRKDIAAPQALLNNITENLQYIAGKIKAQMIKPPETGTVEAKDEREQYCDEFETLADNIQYNNCISFLNLLGTKADKIQKDELKNLTKTNISKFTYFMHGIRDYQLLKILGPASKPSETKELVKPLVSTELKKPEETASSIDKEQYEFAKVILEQQELLTKNIIAQKKEIKCKKMSGAPAAVINSLNDQIDKLRHEAIYVGLINPVIETHVCNALYPPKIFPSHEKDLLPSFPSVIQRNFCFLVIEFIYKKLDMHTQICGKSPAQIIEHFENHAIKKMEEEQKKKIQAEINLQKEQEKIAQINIQAYKRKVEEIESKSFFNFFSTGSSALSLSQSTSSTLSSSPTTTSPASSEQRSLNVTMNP